MSVTFADSVSKASDNSEAFPGKPMRDWLDSPVMKSVADLLGPLFRIRAHQRRNKRSEG